MSKKKKKPVKTNVLCEHRCDGSKEQHAKILFSPKLEWDKRSGYAWWLGDGEYNQFKITNCPFCLEELPYVEVPQLPKPISWGEYAVNKNGNNTKIECHLLSEDQMRSTGFRDTGHGTWYYGREVADDIGFSVSINKENSSDYRIDVIDEDFGQPYDYQHMLATNSENEYAMKIWKNVEVHMKKLTDAGIISGHEYGDYI